VKQYQRLFEMENVRLIFPTTRSRRSPRAIARKDRGARSAFDLEGILLDSMFDLPSLEASRAW